jgi:formylglycine-generating enzyme required for sulfatase activity
MTEEEQALYVKKLALAIKNGLPHSTRLEVGRVTPLEEDSESEKSPSESVAQVWKEPVTGMELNWVEAGSYLMGAGEWDLHGRTDERPVHGVCLDGFWMGKYPVTQGEWKKVVGSNPSYFKLGDDYPVECVSWLDARQFIKKLSLMNDGLYAFRLPTEAEWEYGCRSGGGPEKYAGWAEEDALEELAWHAENSGGMPHPVGSRKPNRLGLYDMSGNVWEWCEDIYSDTAYERHECVNPACCTGEPDRVIRGGSWYTDPDSARCSSRRFLDQTYRRHFVGFRIVRVR